MRKLDVAALLAIACTGCATGVQQTPPSLGEQLSSNLMSIHQAYCAGTPEANQRLTQAKASATQYSVVDPKTGEANKVWVLQAPRVEPASDGTRERWGIRITEKARGGLCGVAYLQPEGLESLKKGVLP